MALVKKVTRHGNSAGVIFDQPIMRHMGWEIGTEVEIQFDGNNRLILTRHEYASNDDVQAAADRMLTRHRKSFERLAK
jgi:antitoxin component of MazEF toxin-antitoxin module